MLCSSGMTAVALRDLNSALSNLQVEVGGGSSSSAARNRSDAQLGIQELRVLRDVDLVTPPEVADLAEPLVEAYRGNVTTGDHLRLQQLTSFDGPAMRASVHRILTADMSAKAGTEAERAAEAKMLRVLSALEDAVSHIQRQSGTSHRG